MLAARRQIVLHLHLWCMMLKVPLAIIWSLRLSHRIIKKHDLKSRSYCQVIRKFLDYKIFLWSLWCFDQTKLSPYPWSQTLGTKAYIISTSSVLRSSPKGGSMEPQGHPSFPPSPQILNPLLQKFEFNNMINLQHMYWRVMVLVLCVCLCVYLLPY